MILDEAIQQLELLAQDVCDQPGSIRLQGHEIVLDNPTARGALTLQMMAELGRIVKQVQHLSVGWIVFRSVGQGTFCSGAHLGQVRGALGAPEAGRAMSEAMTTVLDGLAGAGPLVVGCVDGPALGGGAEIVTSFDLCVAGPRARFGFVQARLGLTTGWGGARRLAAKIGSSQALYLLTVCPVFSAPEAVQNGLIHIYSEANVQAGLDTLTAALERADPASLQSMKRLLGNAVRRDGTETAAFAALWGGPAHQDRVRAHRVGRSGFVQEQVV